MKAELSLPSKPLMPTNSEANGLLRTLSTLNTRLSLIALECERSVGTVFQLPNPDAIYSRDEEKERKVGRHLTFVFAHGPRAAEAR
jgi:hypothetical protein